MVGKPLLLDFLLSPDSGNATFLLSISTLRSSLSP
nr:MAG TPA: hypothetical protein [Caudoviricetes sp.]DAQ87528.1 MAG TPA: hypothetical protein [Caudoviricetes sp.]DAV79336.1 MAG TPA: hypothetical protein [Caudoviricetes sp.]